METRRSIRSLNKDNAVRVREQFGPTAEAYASSEVHARGESLAWLQTLLPSRRETWRVLDVGTGAGHTALTLASDVDRVLATDLTPAMLVKARQLAGQRGLTNMAFQTADAQALPFVTGSLDAVTCRLALHHFPEPEAAFAEWYRVLKPGGWLGLTDNITDNDIEIASVYNRFERLRDPSHHWVFALGRLESRLVEAGFEVIESRELSKEFEFQGWANRQRVSEDDKAVLQKMLSDLNSPLRLWLAPRWADGTVYFSLREAVIVAFKPPTGKSF